MNRKELLFMYIDNSYGIKEEEFNFSTKEQFYVKKNNNIYSITKKKRDKNLLPVNFWGKKISDVSLLIGDNGSGKTTIMRLMCQWISCFSQGLLPQERGIVVLQENNRSGFIAFDKGQKLTITTNLDMKQYLEKELIDFFYDLRLIYFSNSMSELNVGSFRNLSDYSLSNRIKEANRQDTVIYEDIIANYNQYEFNNQVNDALKKKFPIKYLCMEINLLSFEEIKKYLPKEYQYIAADLKGIWEYYFGRYDQKAILERKLSGFELLQIVFIGVIIKFIKWEKDNTTPEEEKFALKTLEEILRWEITTGNETNIDRGQVWVINLLKDLISDSKKKYGKTIYGDKYQSIAKDNIIKYIDRFVKFIVKDIKQEKKVFLVEWKFRLKNEKNCIWQWELNPNNKEFFQEFWDVYMNIVSYVDNIRFYWDASSGECNWASLFSAMHKFEDNDTNIWLLLDEPDIAFHPEWQRKLINKIVLTCNEDYGDRSAQAWISTHSPIMLSDVPGYSVIYLKEKGKYPSPFEETFAQNIYVLFNSAFVLENGIIGEFATDKILEVLEGLNKIERKLFNKEENINELSQKLDYYEKIINLVAEPIFRQQMEKYLLKCKKLQRIRLEDDKDKIT